MTTYCAPCISDLALLREAVTAVGGTASCAAHAVLLTHPQDAPGRRRARLQQLRALAETKSATAPVEEQPGLELLMHEYTLAGAMDMGGQPRPDGSQRPPRGDRPERGDRPDRGERPEQQGDGGGRSGRRGRRGRGERGERPGTGEGDAQLATATAEGGSDDPSGSAPAQTVSESSTPDAPQAAPAAPPQGQAPTTDSRPAADLGAPVSEAPPLPQGPASPAAEQPAGE